MSERLSLIAGSGALVPEVIAAAQRHGYELQILTLGFRPDLRRLRPIRLDPLNPQAFVEDIKAFGATCLAMAGGVRISDAVREGLVRFVGASGGSLGDTGLSALGGHLTRLTGARLVGVHEIAPELLAPQGRIGGPDLTPKQHETAVHALSLARQLGAFDLGQGVVVVGRRPVAAEDIAGTDALLARVRLYRRYGLAADGLSELVFAKAAKPDQPHFVDLPAIGPVTIGKARKAGIGVIALQAGATILIQRSRLVARANAAGVTVLGLPAVDG